MNAGPAPHPGAVLLAATWLLALTVINLHLGGSLRATVLYAVPVAVVAWRSWRAGFVCAAVAVLCAKAGGAMAGPGSIDPSWLDGMLSFAKLSIDAIVVHAWGRRVRRRRDERDTP